MNNDQRLIPFLGGLVIGGAAGSNASKYPQYYNNYPPTYYPMYYNNQPYYYPNQYVQPSPINKTYYTYNEYPIGVETTSDNNNMYQQRSNIDLSYVPIYKKD